ncbi:uncharacterized protein N0V89_009706 [Didymosphaeria variabile]|uniref:Uncharacterized protein n=1 Tax=Didymosphaeria variabile TaxID=1932322 RepID=A0A9W8XEC0_9PLEO|nr:uncharacterized protein N0V89_009706 [Didymosphaeria variabile]KAJ4348332.1 hypothetical protein N0V89_009706 [Didymosphaeria variabile]
MLEVVAMLLVAVEDGTVELVEEKGVGFSVEEVFQIPVHEVMEMIVPDATVPLDVKLTLVLAIVAVDEVAFRMLLLVNKVIVEVILAVEVDSSVHEVGETMVVRLVQVGPVDVKVKDVTGPVPEKLDETPVELKPIPVLVKDEVVEMEAEELLEAVDVTVAALVIVVQ